VTTLPYTFRQEILNIKPYVPGKPIDEVKRELGLTDIIKMASNENPLGPSPKAKQAIVEAVEKLHIYPDGYCFELRRAVAEKVQVDDNQLIFGNGSDEIIKLLAETFLQPGDQVLTGSPSFSEYDYATHLMGGEMVKIPLKNNRFPLEKIAESISSKTKLIFICNPNNPTGTCVSAEEVDRFIAQVPDSVVVIFDEAYNEYVEDENYPDTLKYIKDGKKNVIVLRTFSKIYALASLRIGYGVASPDLIALVSRTREPFNVNSMAQFAAVAALQDREHLELSRKVNSKGKTFLYQAFEDMNLNYIPTEANFIMVDTGKDSKLLFQKMLRKGVIVRTGDIFGMDTYLRVTIGTMEQNQRFIKALKECLEEM
jgi:histidinol-phosphate aminotransferase